jgi:hypothetical protein
MRAGLALLPILLAGCTYPGFGLVDRATFRGPAPAPGEAEMARARLPALPLLTIRFGDPNLDWRPSVAAAVEAAQAGNPDAEFNVLASVPATGDTPPTAERDAKDVADALGFAGVSPERIHLGLRGDPGAPAREVRVYVR